MPKKSGHIYHRHVVNKIRFPEKFKKNPSGGFPDNLVTKRDVIVEGTGRPFDPPTTYILRQNISGVGSVSPEHDYDFYYRKVALDTLTPHNAKTPSQVVEYNEKRVFTYSFWTPAPSDYQSLHTPEPRHVWPRDFPCILGHDATFVAMRTLSPSIPGVLDYGDTIIDYFNLPIRLYNRLVAELMASPPYNPFLNFFAQTDKGVRPVSGGDIVGSANFGPYMAGDTIITFISEANGEFAVGEPISIYQLFPSPAKNYNYTVTANMNNTGIDGLPRTAQITIDPPLEVDMPALQVIRSHRIPDLAAKIAELKDAIDNNLGAFPWTNPSGSEESLEEVDFREIRKALSRYFCWYLHTEVWDGKTSTTPFKVYDNGFQTFLTMKHIERKDFDEELSLPNSAAFRDISVAIPGAYILDMDIKLKAGLHATPYKTYIKKGTAVTAKGGDEEWYYALLRPMPYPTAKAECPATVQWN